MSQTPLGINDFKNKIELITFPNPSSRSIKISGLTNTEKYTIFNSIGAKMAIGTISNKQSIDITNLMNGLYFIKFENGTALKFIRE